MKKIASLALVLALFSGSASAAIHWSEGRPSPNEIPLAPYNVFGQMAPAASQFHDLMPSVPGLEMIARQNRSTTLVGTNQTYSHNYAMYNSNTGAVVRVMPAMSYTAPQGDIIEFTKGFLTIGAGVAAKTYSVESMYSWNPVTMVQGAMNVRVIEHPAAGAVVVKFNRVFPASSADGTIQHDVSEVKDITGDGVEELVVRYTKRVGLQRVHTFLIHNVVTGLLTRRLVVTTN